MEDREIIQLFFDRDERAITESRDKYGKYCDGIAAGILHTREDREECVSDTWLRAWQTIPPQNPASLKAYLGRLCRCFAIDRYRHLRRRKRSRDMECVLTELDGICPNEPVTDGLKETLTAFLRGLEPLERDLFVGRYWYAYTPERLVCRRCLDCSRAGRDCPYHAHHAPSARVPKPDSGREYCRV